MNGTARSSKEELAIHLYSSAAADYGDGEFILRHLPISILDWPWLAQ
jgi:hypothetical protein